MDNSEPDTYVNIIRNIDENRAFMEKQHKQLIFLITRIEQINKLINEHDNSKHCKCNLAKDIRKKSPSLAKFDKICTYK